MTNAIPTSPAERRARLLAAKLAAIVRDAMPGRRHEPGSFPPGAALSPATGRGCCSTPSIDDGIGLGAAIIWALRNGAAELDLVADDALGDRRPSRRRVPPADPRLGARRHRTASPCRRPRFAAPSRPTAAHLALVDDIEAAGAVGGRRARRGHRRGARARGVPRRRRRHRRRCRRAARGRRRSARPGGVRDHPRRRPDTRGARRRRRRRGRGPLARTRPVTRSTAWRRSGCCAGASNRSRGSSAWRRCARPSRRCRAAASSTDRPCTAAGRRLDGSPVVIVCSVGVDLDVIPYAADARLAAVEAGVGRGGLGSPAETVVVLPERDLLPVTAELASQLRHSVSLLGLSRLIGRRSPARQRPARRR